MITAPTAAGAFYGVQSLLSLNAGNEGRIQPMIVKVCDLASVFQYQQFRIYAIKREITWSVCKKAVLELKKFFGTKRYTVKHRWAQVR